MALAIKHDDDEKETKEGLHLDGWQNSSTAKALEEGDSNAPKEIEFNPEQEFDTFKVPTGVEMDRRELTSGGSNPGLHIDPPNESKPKIIKISISLVSLLIVLILVKVLAFPTPKDLTADRNMDPSQLSGKYGFSFTRDEGMDKYMPQWTDKRTIEVSKDKGLCVINVDGQYKGFHFDNKKYTFGGLKVGDPEIHMFDDITFKYENDYQILNDMMGGNSEADYFVNWTTNEVLVVTVSDRTNRIVALTYYNDAKTILEALTFD